MKKTLVVLILLSLLTACDDRKMTICTTSYPMEWLVKHLADVEANHCSLAKGDFFGRATLDETMLDQPMDVIFFNQQLEPYFRTSRSQLARVSKQIIDLSATSRSLPYKKQVTASGSQDYYEALNDYVTNKYTVEPVHWMDMKMMTSMARTMLDWLIENDAVNAALYTQRFKNLEIDLLNLDARFSELALSSDIKFAAVSSAFNVWNHTYGIDVFPIIISRYGVLPNQQQLEIIVDELIANNVHFLIYEFYEDEDLMDLQDYLLQEVGLTPVYLSSMFALNSQQKLNNENYISIMTNNLVLLEALQK